MTSVNCPRYEIIATGSQGNAVVIEGEILIDCGVSWRALEPYWRRLRLVLLTHAHSDHFNQTTVQRLAAERPTLRCGCGAWMIQRLLRCKVHPGRIDVMNFGKVVHYGDYLAAKTFCLPHDVPNCGYALQTRGGSLLYATDASNLDDVSAPNLNLYLLEANHEVNEIQQRIAAKHAAGEYAYEKRAQHMHLSREQCDDFFCRMGGPNSILVYMHCHVDKEEVA